MAVCCMDIFPSEILNYLLVDAWDIENSNRIQSVLWSKRLFRGSLDTVFQLSRRMSALGQTINTDLIHDILEDLDRLLNRLDSAQIIIDDVCKLLINQGADIEYRDPFSEETVLLVAAEGDGNISLKLMPVLSRLGADYSVVDYKGRTPLHLALKPSRSYTAVAISGFYMFLPRQRTALSPIFLSVLALSTPISAPSCLGSSCYIKSIIP